MAEILNPYIQYIQITYPNERRKARNVCPANNINNLLFSDFSYYLCIIERIIRKKYETDEIYFYDPHDVYRG